MKFTYQYRTSDNVQHEDVIEAKSRDDVYAQLRLQGIKPVRVSTPRIPWWRRISLRWVAIVILGGALSALLLWRVHDDRDATAAAIGRRQIWGDRAIIDAAAKEHWRVIFANPADRLLALYAQPGVRFTMPIIPATIKDDFARAIRTTVAVSDTDLEEYRQMKRIVEGMKDELRAYLSDGGSVEGYLSRLADRQSAEASIYDRERVALAEAARTKSMEEVVSLWNEANRRLRSLGLQTLAIPYKNKLKIGH